MIGTDVQNTTLPALQGNKKKIKKALSSRRLPVSDELKSRVRGKKITV
jgi:hypothetical protein